MDTTLLTRIEAFLVQHAMSERDFGVFALNDTRFVYDLRSGREPRSRTRIKVEKWMRDWDSEHIALSQAEVDAFAVAL